MDAHGQIIQSSFKPAWWLTNPHLQTVWGSLSGRNEKLFLKRERIELPDGDFLDVDWAEPLIHNPNSPIVMVLHGLGGSIQSHYAQGILQTIVNHGWRGMFMHFRGASGMPNRLPRTYHSGDTEDVNYISRLLSIREPKATIMAVGYSLGGNVLLKWLAETGINNPISRAVAVSVPFELHKAATRLTEGFSQFYQWVILRQLREHMQQKFKRIKSPIDMQGLDNIKTFWQFDSLVTAPLHGFIDVHHYYASSSTRPMIQHIQKPTLIIHSFDDPFMTPDCVPTAQELSPYVKLELTQQGGHVGFVSGTVPGRPVYWLEDRIMEYFLAGE